jgi:Domain of unknown function (DUF6265)
MRKILSKVCGLRAPERQISGFVLENPESPHRPTMRRPMGIARGAFAISVASLVLLSPARSIPKGVSPADQAATHVAASPATLADFAWLEGRWRGDWGPRVAEQVWMSPKAGLMLGTLRLVEDNKTLLIELFALLQKPGGVEFRFRHFTPELAPWEKSGATVLTLESFDAKRVVFVNSVNGQPKRAIIRRIDQDSYVSRSEIVPASGAIEVIEIIYHRQKPSTPGDAKAHR